MLRSYHSSVDVAMSPSVKKAYVEFRDKRKFAPLALVKKEKTQTIIVKRNGLIIKRILK